MAWWRDRTATALTAGVDGVHRNDDRLFGLMSGLEDDEATRWAILPEQRRIAAAMMIDYPYAIYLAIHQSGDHK